MVLEHEIPEGSKLHFGLSAALKRKVENVSAELFYAHGFEEIVSPTFVYQEHQKNFLNRDVIRLSSEKNNQIAMRNDSTIDVIRIVTKRLGRATTQKKWFYIQPVFSYPTIEHNQIGVECLDNTEYNHILNLGITLFENLNITPLLQITNARIAKLCATHSNLPYSDFATLNIEKLQNIDYIAKLLRIHDRESLIAFMPQCPSFLREDMEYLMELCDCEYTKLTCAPLLPVPVEYYNDVYFRMVIGNSILLSGGISQIDGTLSCGFGIYTDSVIQYLLKHNQIVEKD